MPSFECMRMYSMKMLICFVYLSYTFHNDSDNGSSNRLREI